MRVLVACEYSGRVRDAFLGRGHDAVSCDLLPTDVQGPHYQGDVCDILHEDRWKIRSETYIGVAEAMASQWG